MRTDNAVRLSNRPAVQIVAVTNPRPRTRKILVRNLKTLMEVRGMTQRALAQASGVSQGQLSAILNDKSACSIEAADALAAVFGLTSWHLLVHDLPRELIDSPRIGQIVADYVKLNGEGREYVDATIRRESGRRR